MELESDEEFQEGQGALLERYLRRGWEVPAPAVANDPVVLHVDPDADLPWWEGMVIGEPHQQRRVDLEPIGEPAEVEPWVRPGSPAFVRHVQHDEADFQVEVEPWGRPISPVFIRQAPCNEDDFQERQLEYESGDDEEPVVNDEVPDILVDERPWWEEFVDHPRIDVGRDPLDFKPTPPQGSQPPIYNDSGDVDDLPSMD
ncbi:unnamed protein product [Caenorhabditis nigoni]